MTSVSRQIECALTDVKLAIDESFADEDPIVLASITDIRALALREIDALVATRSRISASARLV